ncbi:MAG TPA: cupin domain-containing protein [Clostridiales bacterium]|nr:cupin domain-containing protein [Clostridiales bacterium]HCU56509.1 cupin domain-containing protein [Clostridiales bacterium]
MDKVRLSGRGGVVNLRKATLYNDYFRRELWTGEHLQITVMAIPVGGEVGKEIHLDLDQLLVVEQGSAAVFMGSEASDLEYVGDAEMGDGILVPAGTYHNVYNDGRIPLKVFSVYAPPKHPIGTLQRTKADADAQENAEE